MNRVVREFRWYSPAPEEEERLSRKAWSPCDHERVHFNHGNKNAVCYQPNGSLEYRDRQRPTIARIRRLVRDGQDGRCARSKQELPGSEECRSVVPDSY